MYALIDDVVYDVPPESIAEWIVEFPELKKEYDVTLEKFITEAGIAEAIKKRGGMLVSEFELFVTKFNTEHMKIKTDSIRFKYGAVGKEAFEEYKTDMTKEEMIEMAMSAGKVAYDSGQGMLNDGSGFVKM